MTREYVRHCLRHIFCSSCDNQFVSLQSALPVFQSTMMMALTSAMTWVTSAHHIHFISKSPPHAHHSRITRACSKSKASALSRIIFFEGAHFRDAADTPKSILERVERIGLVLREEYVRAWGRLDFNGWGGCCWIIATKIYNQNWNQSLILQPHQQLLAMASTPLLHLHVTSHEWHHLGPPQHGQTQHTQQPQWYIVAKGLQFLKKSIMVAVKVTGYFMGS